MQQSSVQWHKNRCGGRMLPGMHSRTVLLSPMNSTSPGGRVPRSSAATGGPRASTQAASVAQTGMAACRVGGWLGRERVRPMVAMIGMS